MRIVLPYPPSVNTYWRHVGNRTLISAAGRKYIRDVGDIVLRQKDQVFGKSLLSMAIILFHPDKRRRDIDNALKAILDALAKAGVYNDDSQIESLFVERYGVVEGGKAHVYIEPRREPLIAPTVVGLMRGVK